MGEDVDVYLCSCRVWCGVECRTLRMDGRPRCWCRGVGSVGCLDADIIADYRPLIDSLAGYRWIKQELLQRFGIEP